MIGHAAHESDSVADAERGDHRAAFRLRPPLADQDQEKPFVAETREALEQQRHAVEGLERSDIDDCDVAAAEAELGAPGPTVDGGVEQRGIDPVLNVNDALLGYAALHEVPADGLGDCDQKARLADDPAIDRPGELDQPGAILLRLLPGRRHVIENERRAGRGCRHLAGESEAGVRLEDDIRAEGAGRRDQPAARSPGHDHATRVSQLQRRAPRQQPPDDAAIGPHRSRRALCPRRLDPQHLVPLARQFGKERRGAQQMTGAFGRQSVDHHRWETR